MKCSLLHTPVNQDESPCQLSRALQQVVTEVCMFLCLHFIYSLHQQHSTSFPGTFHCLLLKPILMSYKMIPNQLTFLQKLFTSCVPFLTFSEFTPCPLPSGCLAVRCIYFTPSPELRMMKQPEKDDERSVALTQKQFFFFPYCGDK